MKFVEDTFVEKLLNDDFACSSYHRPSYTVAEQAI